MNFSNSTITGFSAYMNPNSIYSCPFRQKNLLYGLYGINYLIYNNLYQGVIGVTVSFVARNCRSYTKMVVRSTVR